MNETMLILKQPEIERVLKGREAQIMALVKEAYIAHDQGQSSLPHSLFLRFPRNAKDRIIALPAYLDGDEPVAGVKWVSSFPGNRDKGLPRASAVIIINSVATGYPEAILEGSVISARRTAASAALAALHLSSVTDSIGIIGAGVIALETLRFIVNARDDVNTINVKVYDVDKARACQFVERCNNSFQRVQVGLAGRMQDALYNRLVLFATTAPEPYVTPDMCLMRPSCLLHISLRDLAPELLLRHVNIVDDLNHVNRERTSVHLASMMAGDTRFVRGTLADVMKGRVGINGDEVVIFSPFGLGVLDVSLARMVITEAKASGVGLEVLDFFSAA